MDIPMQSDSIESNQFIFGSPPTEYTEVRSIIKKPTSPSNRRKNEQASSPHPDDSLHPLLKFCPIPKPSDKPFCIRLIAGTGNKKLAKNISNYLNTNIEPSRNAQFADGECDIHIENNVRGDDLFIIQPVSPPEISTHLIELCLLIHTLQLSSPKRITAVVPYYPYSRQDRKSNSRVPIGASVVAQLIECMNPHRVLTVDLHSGQIQGFFHNTPVDNLLPEKEMLRYFESKKYNKENVVFVSPDAGGVLRAKQAADLYQASTLVTILKRKMDNKIDMQLAGDVRGMICIIVDDLIDTGDTIVTAAKLLKSNGATEVIAFVTHGVLSGNAIQKINETEELTELCVTDSIPQDENLKKCKKLRVYSIVLLLAEAIERIHHEKSLSELFKH